MNAPIQEKQIEASDSGLNEERQQQHETNRSEMNASSPKQNETGDFRLYVKQQQLDVHLKQPPKQCDEAIINDVHKPRRHMQREQQKQQLYSNEHQRRVQQQLNQCDQNTVRISDIYESIYQTQNKIEATTTPNTFEQNTSSSISSTDVNKFNENSDVNKFLVSNNRSKNKSAESKIEFYNKYISNR